MEQSTSKPVTSTCCPSLNLSVEEETTIPLKSIPAIIGYLLITPPLVFTAKESL